MKELIIKNYDYNVIVKENNIERKYNASFELFDLTQDNIFEMFLNVFYNFENQTNYLSSCIFWCGAYSGIPEHKIKYDSIIGNGNTISSVYYGLENLPSENDIKKYIDIYINNEKNININCTTTYFCKDNKDMVISTIYHYIKNGKQFKKCQCCEKYFFPHHRSDEKYCLRKNKLGETCKEIQQKKSKKEYESNIIIHERKKIYNKLQKRIERATDDKEIKIARNELYEFEKEFGNQKNLYNDGKISEHDFINWIKKN